MISPMQSVIRFRAGREVGTALQVRFAQKMRKYHAVCREADIDFIPLPVSTLGG